MNSTHQELRFTSYKAKFTCHGCKMDGYGERYRCDEFSDFNLHKECVFPEPTASPEPFKAYNFKFLRRPPPGRRCPGGGYCGSCRSCDVCGTTVEGFVYHCDRKDLDVHPLCALLKREIRVNDVVFKLRDRAVSKCIWCEKRRLRDADRKVPGCCYVSSCGQYGFHVYCLMEMGMQSCTGVDGVGSGDGGRSRALVIRCPDVSLEKKGRRGGSGSKFINVVKAFLKIALSVLFGDPTTFLATVIVQLLTN